MVTKMTKLMISAMQPVHRMNHALFLTATALVTRRRVMRLRHHRLHHLPAMGGYCGEGSTQFATWGTATRTTLVLVTCCIVVFVVFFF